MDSIKKQESRRRSSIFNAMNNLRNEIKPQLKAKLYNEQVQLQPSVFKQKDENVLQIQNLNLTQILIIKNTENSQKVANYQTKQDLQLNQLNNSQQYQQPIRNNFMIQSTNSNAMNIYNDSKIEDQKTLDQKEMGNEIQTIKESFEDEVDKKFKFFQLSASKIITHQIFEFCTILVIVSNSIVLALEDPTNKNQTSNSSGSFSLSGLRAFRVLRPLRAVSSIEGLKILVQALLAALPLLRDTVIILMFFFLIFGIAGVQLFHGQLKKRCVFIETGKQHLDNLLCGGSQECPPGFFCGKRFESPNGDVTNFDNMLYAILTVFQSVTLEGWSYVMVDVQSVFGVFGILFFIPLVFIGAFFLLNLTLAVINSKFTEAHKRQTEKNKHNNSHKKFKKFLRGDPDLEIFNNHLSIRQFQIAQKTAKQMIKFLRDQQQRKNTEKEKQKLLRQKLNIIHPEQDSNKQTSRVKTLEANKDSDKVFQIRNEQHQEIDQLLPFDNIEILRPNVYQSEVGNKAESQMSREMLSSLEELKFSTQNSRKQIIIDQQAIDISDYENEKSIINSENSIQLQEYNLKKSNNFKLNTLEQDDRIVLSKQILIEPEVKRPSFRKQWTQIDVKQGQKNGQNLSEVKIRKSSTKLGQFIQTQSPIKESKSVDRQIRQYDIALNSSLGMSDQQKMSPDLKYKTQDNNFLEHKNSFTLNYIEKSKQTDLKQLNLQEKIGSKLKHNIVQQTLQQKTKKLQLAKNAQYKSTSLREVLEKRSPAKVSMITTNKKTKVQNNSPNHYYDSPYKIIEHKQNFKPYQQKSIYNIYSDEEDDYLFLDTQNIQDSQPYDTVTGIGYQEALQKLQTKQIARKSELVITSTLSFTYQPKEIPKKLRIGLNESKIMEDYVQNSAIKRSNSLSKIIDDSQNQVSNSKEEINHSFTQKIKPQINQFIQMTPQLTNLRRKPRGSIVATSLQRLLTKNQIQIGSGQNPNKTSTIYQRRKSVRNFNNQTPDPKSMIMFKSLFDSSRQKINKMKQMQKQLKVDGNNKKFTVKEAKKLFDGTFYSSEDEIVQPKNLYRSMHQKPGNSLSFDQDHSLLTEFEMDTQKQLENRNADRKLKENSFFKDSDKFNYCEVPQEVREELSLPEDVQGQDVDIMKIKKFEDLHKKKNKFWSGQDVLERKPGRKQLIDEERARWVISQLNSIRVWPRGFHGTFKKFRVFLKKIVLSNIFENFMLLSVLINTIVLSADRYNISQDEEATLITINNFFSALFIAEMCIKLFSNGVRKYLSDKLNYLDGIVVILSIVEIILNQSGNSSGTQKLSAFKTVRIFRTFRVLRVARLLRSLRSMQVIIGVIQRSVMSFVYIASLLLLFIFIFALLGMQIFGGQFKNHEFENSANYDTFHDAFITVFQVLTIENWQTILYESMNTNLGKIIPAIYYTTWIFMGNFILLNLFLAILLDSFIEEEEDKENQEFLDQEKHKAKTIQSKNQFQKSQKNLAIKAKQIQQNKARRKSVLKIFSESQNEIDIEDAQRNEEIEGIRDLEEMDEADIHKILIDNEIVQPSQSLKKDVKQTKLDLVRLFQYVYCQKSFYIFSRVIIQIHFQQFQQRNKFRIRLFRMTKHRYFERLILFIIVLSSIKLAIDTYLLDYPSDSEIVNILVYESYFQIQLSNYIDILFTFLFTVECIIKSICLGFVQDKGSYLRETWNILDFFIVISSLIDLALVEIDIPFIKILRLLRTLRPLRFISHNIQMKTVVVALFESIGHIFNVMIVVMIVWLMFAILGVNLFSGKFFYCTIDTFQTSTMKECYDKKGKWLIYDHNFDNVGNAMITLFAVSTLEDWPQIMYQAVNVNDENRGPIINNIPANAYFFVIFIFIGSYFLLNFFIGVLFLKYNEAQKAETKGFTQEHLQWLDMQRMIINTKPDFETTNIPKQTWRKRIHRLVGLPQFDVLIMICIILNMIQMACLFEGTSPGYREILDQLNVVFSLIFLIEAILKIIAYGFSYFENSWNKFDFIIVLTSLIDLALSLLSTNSLKFLRVGPQLARVLRVARVTRVIRLVGKYQGLQALIQTITFSLPSLLNVLGLLLLVFFMFSVLGVFFFKEIKTGVIINEYMNFKNFGNAILILFRMSTGEDWNFIMFDCAREPSDGCIEGVNCGNKIISYIYFISFIMICTNIMLNLFVLVIIQQFDKYYLPQNNIISLFKQDLIGFKDTWKNFTMDKYNCKKIKESQLTQFFQELKAPLGMPNIKDQDLKKNMLKMGIKSDIAGYIYFNELLYRCMKRIYGQLQLNKQMQINELKTQYKLIQRSISESQSMRMFKNQDILELMTSKSNSVNPFLTVMFFKMSFKRWLNYTSLNKKRRRKLRRFQKYSNQQLTVAQMEIYKNQIHQFEQKKIEDDKQGQLEFDYEEEEEVLILYPQSDDEKNSLSKSVSSDCSFSDSDLDRDVANSNKSKKSSSKSRITKKISKNKEVLEDSESNDTINQSQDNSFRHLVDQNTDRINLKDNFRKKLSIKNENISTSDFDRNSIKLVGNILKNSLQNQPGENIKIKVKKRSRKNFDTIEEEDEIYSLPSLPKKKRSSKQFKFL
eukprot:403363663